MKEEIKKIVDTILTNYGPDINGKEQAAEKLKKLFEEEIGTVICNIVNDDLAEKEKRIKKQKLEIEILTEKLMHAKRIAKQNYECYEKLIKEISTELEEESKKGEKK